jgi:hypothetical protein
MLEEIKVKIEGNLDFYAILYEIWENIRTLL